MLHIFAGEVDERVPWTTAVHISHTSLSEPGDRSSRLPQSAQKTRVPTVDIAGGVAIWRMVRAVELGAYGGSATFFGGRARAAAPKCHALLLVCARAWRGLGSAHSWHRCLRSQQTTSLDKSVHHPKSIRDSTYRTSIVKYLLVS